ncbi:MAG: type secretory pathway, pseudopilin PulG [Chthoniobacteraceae bacterium]|nr:type secretory pathway, pseudopilin PulG [Chthoniobacteraceae bacterium]
MNAARPRGFTLIEILVVLAIVAVLAALLFGAMESAQGAGHSAHCVENLRQLAAANILYASENNGQLVNAQDRNNRLRWHGVRESISGPFRPDQGPLAPFLGTDRRVKLCPSLRSVLLGDASFEDSTGGYGYNAIYVGGTPRDRFTAERLANIPHPSRTIMFTDTAFARANGIQEYPYCEPFKWVDAAGRLAGPLSASVHFRHQGHANVAWCDGHISAEIPSRIDFGNPYGGDSKKWQIGWFGPSAENGWWNTAADENAPR